MMRRIVVTTFAVLTLALGAGLWLNHLTAELPPDAVVSQPPRAMKAATAPAVTFSADAVQQWQQKLAQQTPFTARPEQTELWFIQHANRLIQSVDHISSQQLQRQLLTDLLRSPGQLALAEKLLTDLAFASQTYGTEQALARVVAIKLLHEAARQQDVAPLERTIRQLSQTLDQQASQGRAFEKAQQQDLADLLNYRLRLNPLSTTPDELTLLLQELGYQNRQQPQIREIYGDVLFFALKKQYGRDKATALTAQALQESTTTDPAG